MYAHTTIKPVSITVLYMGLAFFYIVTTTAIDLWKTLGPE